MGVVLPCEMRVKHISKKIRQGLRLGLPAKAPVFCSCADTAYQRVRKKGNSELFRRCGFASADEHLIQSCACQNSSLTAVSHTTSLGRVEERYANRQPPLFLLCLLCCATVLFASDLHPAEANSNQAKLDPMKLTPLLLFCLATRYLEHPASS